jgi:hypothetical protein
VENELRDFVFTKYYNQPLFYALVAFVKKWSLIKKKASIKNDIPIRNKGLVQKNAVSQAALNRK